MTREELQDALQRDLAWRKQEIYNLRLSATRSRKSSSFLCRAGTVLICAHWEGFLKSSINTYIEYVFSQNIKLHDLKPCFISIAYFSDIIKAAESRFPGSKENHEKLAKRIKSSLHLPPENPRWNANTEGNPSSSVVQRLMSSVALDIHLGLEPATWSGTKVFIDEQILRDRNHIAHGAGLQVSKEEILSRYNRIIEIFEAIERLILKGAEEKLYLDA